MSDQASQNTKLNYLRGALFAIGGPIVGIILWVIIWEMGFIASIASLALAWLTVWLYKKGAGGVDRKSLYVIVPYIVVGIVLCILAAMVDDLANFLIEDSPEARALGTWGLITDANFWSILFDNLLHNGAVWNDYASTIIFSIGLGALGVYGTIRDVIVSTISASASAPEQPTKDKSAQSENQD